VPAEVREQLTFHPVEMLREVLDIALVGGGRVVEADEPAFAGV
jgi:hypothetical protein